MDDAPGVLALLRVVIHDEELEVGEDAGTHAVTLLQLLLIEV